MNGEPSAESLLARAEQAWTGGDGAAAHLLYEQAYAAAEAAADLPLRARAVLGLARGQEYNLVPGTLPVRLHAVYQSVQEPALRARLAAALGRCWAYANEPRRAGPFAMEALDLAARTDDPTLVADALDAALASHWGPDDQARRRDWAVRLGDTAAHLPDPDARLQAQLWALSVAWEVLDLPAMHRALGAIEGLAAESVRAEFFAASRRLPVELLRRRPDRAPDLIRRATAAAAAVAIPDSFAVLHSMAGYAALFGDDPAGCAVQAPEFEAYAIEFGVAVVQAEAAMIWLGAGRPDKVEEMIGPFSAEVLAGLPRDSDWLLTLQCLLEGALFVGDRPVVEAVVALLGPYAGRSVVNAGAVMWHGVTDDTLARAHALLGDPAAAQRHRAAALATYRRIGATWWRDRLLRELPAETGESVAGGDSRVTTIHLHQQPGGLWLVGREGATFVLPAMRGLAHLHTLLEHPEADVPAQTLAGALVEQGDLEVLDEESRHFLQSRLARLEAEPDLAERADLREEREAILTYLGHGTGLGGRRRVTGSAAERARVAVRKAVVAALARIADTDPWLARHLRDHVHTGFGCSYRADPDHPVRWILTSAPGPLPERAETG